MADNLLESTIEKWYLWLPIVLYFLFKESWGTDTIYVTMEWLVMYYLFLAIFWALNEQGKYGSPMFVVNNEHICCKQPVVAGDWTIFTDYIDAPEFFMTYPLNTKTIVVPTSSVYKIGQNYMSTSRVVKYDYHSLPYHAQEVVAGYKMSTQNVYHGMFSEAFERELETATKAQQESLELIKQELSLYRDASSKNRETAKYNLSDIEGLKSSFDRLQPKRQTLFDSLLGPKTNNNEVQK